MDYLRPGEALFITKLDRLGRSVRNLRALADDLPGRQLGLSQGMNTTSPGGRLSFHMLAAIAELERDLIVERTHDGLAAARVRGRQGGPKFTMTPSRAKQARAMYDAGQHTVQEIADTCDVSRPTIYRHLTGTANPAAPATPSSTPSTPASSSATTACRQPAQNGSSKA